MRSRAELDTRIGQLFKIAISTNWRMLWGWQPTIRDIIQLTEYQVEAEQIKKEYAQLGELKKHKVEPKKSKLEHIDTIV